MRMNKVSCILWMFSVLFAFAQPQLEKLKISPLTTDFYVFTTYHNLKGKLYPANGMYMLTQKGVVLFDTPWDSTQYQPLLDSIKIKHKQHVVLILATHSHEDRAGGFEYYRNKGIPTLSSAQTDSLLKQEKRARAEFVFQQDTLLQVGEHRFQTYFAGQGHTSDNIIVWFASEKILYGGCLIKSTEAQDLGNIKDANLKEWSRSIENIQHKFNSPKWVIPGHQDWRYGNALEHTLGLLKKVQ